MALNDIVERILADANAEAQAIISEAEARAVGIRKEAENAVKQQNEASRKEIEMKSRAYSDGKQATARLDAQKIMLAEKRRVIQTAYVRAFESLLSLGEKESVGLYTRLLENYAEAGDEVVLSPNYRYLEKLRKARVVTERKLTFVTDSSVEGGLLLRGKKADCNLTFSALLSADKEAHQAEIL